MADDSTRDPAPPTTSTRRRKVRRSTSLERGMTSSELRRSASDKNEMAQELDSLRKTVAEQQMQIVQQGVMIEAFRKEHDMAERSWSRLIINEVAKQTQAAKQAADAEETEHNDDTVDLTATADEGDIANLYSYCVECSLRTRKPLNMLMLLVVVSTMSFMQVVYAYGFQDASLLLMSLTTLPAFKDPVPLSLFYAKSIVPMTLYNPETMGGTDVPMINFVSSIISLALLAFMMKNDSEGTLMTTNPLEAALLPDIPTTSDNAHKHRARRCLVEVCRFVLCLVLQFLASVRSLLLPVMAGLGTAGCFVAAKDAQEIVLNSVAIAFVFELDDLLYATMLSKKRREEFESHPLRPTSPLASSAGRQISSSYAWILCVLDAAAMITYYVGNTTMGTESLPSFFYDVNRSWLFCRAGIFTVAQLHLALYSGRLKGGVSKIAFWIGMLALPLGLLGYAAIVFTIQGDADFLVGQNPAPVIFDELALSCAMSAQEGPECTDMVTFEPSIHERMVAWGEAMMPEGKWTYYEMLWGRNVEL